MTTMALLALGLLAAPIQTWLMLGGDFGEYLRFDTLRGQELYVLSKPCALLAIELLWLQALLGLLRPGMVRSGWLGAAAWRRWHRGLGIAALAAMLAHVALFVVAASLRNKAAAVDLLWPWGHGVYRSWVAVGAAALWMIIAAATVQFARLFVPVLRRWVHLLALAAVVPVALHSLMIGSEARSGAMAGVYALMGASLAAAVLWRFTGGRAALNGR